MESLPLKLSNAIDRELASLNSDVLRNACFDLSQRYARGEYIGSHLHRQAYIAARLPATYGAIRYVFRQIEPYLSKIKSLLDLGAGVGTVAWAAHESMPNLQKATLYEQDIELLRLGQHLAQESLLPLQVSWCRDDITKEEMFPTFDAITLSYVLNELSLKEQSYVLKRAYEATEHLLILIEPGTPEGFGHILTARQMLIEMGAHILAPCPHSQACPLVSAYQEQKDWCHFSVRIPRGKYHRRAKAGALPYEDEKFSYLVVSPQPFRTAESRVIKAPIRKTGHVILDLCLQDGKIERQIVSKRDGESYARARDIEWGDEWEG